MKSNSMKAMLAAFVFIAMLGSCKKSSDKLTRTEMMVGTWNLNAYGVDDNNNGILEASEYDAIPAGAAMEQTYRSDGTGVFMTQGPANLPVYSNVNWLLTDNEQNLRVVSNGNTTNATISVLTEHELQGYDPAQSPRYVYLLTK